ADLGRGWCLALLLLGNRLLSLLASERVRKSVLEHRAITFHGIQHRLDMLRVAASSGLNVQTIVSGNGMGLAKLEKPQGRLLKVFLGTAVAELLSRLFEEMGHVVGLFSRTSCSKVHAPSELHHCEAP